MVKRFRLILCMVELRTLLARPTASSRIMWRDCVKRMPSDTTKMGIARRRMPMLSFLANALRTLNMSHLLSFFGLFLLVRNIEKVLEHLGDGVTTLLNIIDHP